MLQTGEDLHIRLWDARTMQRTQLLPAHQNIPLCCACSDNGLLPHVHAAVCPLSPCWLACCAHIDYPLPTATTVKQTATMRRRTVSSSRVYRWQQNLCMYCQKPHWISYTLLSVEPQELLDALALMVKIFACAPSSRRASCHHTSALIAHKMHAELTWVVS